MLAPAIPNFTGEQRKQACRGIAPALGERPFGLRAGEGMPGCPGRAGACAAVNAVAFFVHRYLSATTDVLRLVIYHDCGAGRWMSWLCVILLTSPDIVSAHAFTCADVRALSLEQRAYYIRVYSITVAEQERIRHECSGPRASIARFGHRARSARIEQ